MSFCKKTKNDKSVQTLGFTVTSITYKQCIFIRIKQVSCCALHFFFWSQLLCQTCWVALEATQLNYLRFRSCISLRGEVIGILLPPYKGMRGCPPMTTAPGKDFLVTHRATMFRA